MCVTSLLCGPRADLLPFYGFLCKRFSLYIKVYKGWIFKTVLSPIIIWRWTSRDFVTHLTASGPKRLAPLAKKLVKLDSEVVSTLFQELCHLLAIFLDCSSSPGRSLLISKPTLGKTILSSSFVLESCTKTDKLSFFFFFRGINFQNPGKNGEYVHVDQDFC